MHFEFKTQCLDLPQCSNGKDFLALEKDTMEQIESTEASMGKDLDQIFDILNDNSAYDQVGTVVVEHKWNNASKKFEY